MGDDSTGVRAGFEGDGEKGMSSRMGEGGYTPRNVEGEAPVFVSVASKGLKERVISGQGSIGKTMERNPSAPDGRSG
jgi:hypothetical protein